MNEPLPKGNNPERWRRLLDSLDEKLQFGLLDQLKKVASYHFEEQSLYLGASTLAQAEYLKQAPVLQQIQLLAQDVVQIERVIVEFVEQDAK